MSEEDRQGNARADELAGRAAHARQAPLPLAAARAAVLTDLEAAQRVLAAVELAAIRANRGGDRADGRRVPPRRAWRPRRGLRPEAAGAQAAALAPFVAGLAAAPPVVQPADACRALFAGRAWTPHAAAQGPGFTACLQCGRSEPSWPALAAMPCPGWAPALQARARAVLLLPQVRRAGGSQAAFTIALERRLGERPRAPD